MQPKREIHIMNCLQQVSCYNAMKNADIKQKMDYYGIEWVEVASYLHMPMKDFTRRLNGKEASPPFRRNLLKAIDSIRRRSETFYDEFR